MSSKELREAIAHHQHAMRLEGYLRGADDSLYLASRDAITSEALLHAIEVHRRKITEDPLPADHTLWQRASLTITQP